MFSDTYLISLVVKLTFGSIVCPRMSILVIPYLLYINLHLIWMFLLLEVRILHLDLLLSRGRDSSPRFVQFSLVLLVSYWLSWAPYWSFDSLRNCHNWENCWIIQYPNHSTIQLDIVLSNISFTKSTLLCGVTERSLYHYRPISVLHTANHFTDADLTLANRNSNSVFGGIRTRDLRVTYVR